MKISEVQFEFVCKLEPEKEPDGRVVALMPQSRYRNTKGLPHNAYGKGPFCKFRIPKMNHTTGVYALVVQGAVKYVGECVKLPSRYNAGYGHISPRNCFKQGRETNCRLNSQIYREVCSGRDVELWFHPSPNHKALEKQLLSLDIPPWNRGRKRSK